MRVYKDGVIETQTTKDPELALILDDSTTANTVYICTALVGTLSSAAAWQVKKLDTSSGSTTTWADGNALFDNIADNRASLSYS